MLVLWVEDLWVLVLAAFLQRGFQVCCLKVSQERADLCLKTVQDYFSQKQAQQKITQSHLHEIMQRFHVTMKITDFAQFDLVIEAVFENLKLKCDLLKELDQVCAEKTILATNTSGLNIKKMAACTQGRTGFWGCIFSH